MKLLLTFIVICGLFLVFILFNLDNKSDVSFGFRVFSDIPVFLTAFSSFVLGMVFAVPFVLSFWKRKKKSPGAEPSDLSSPPKGLKKLFGRKNKSQAMDFADSPDDIKKENSPYGID